eukprot:COSAG02_NODE_195_length_29750_cov_79.793329_12_plen_107_part_00
MCGAAGWAWALSSRRSCEAITAMPPLWAICRPGAGAARARGVRARRRRPRHELAAVNYIYIIHSYILYRILPRGTDTTNSGRNFHSRASVPPESPCADYMYVHSIR